jgi:hypothetical protein
MFANHNGISPDRLAARRFIEDKWREAHGYPPGVELGETDVGWAFLEGLLAASPPPATYGIVVEVHNAA